MTEHTKLFAGLLGLALTGMTAQAAAPSLSYKINGNEFIITYTGTLYQSSDAVSWTEVASASSPYVVTLGDKKLFFCAKGEEGPSENITIPLSDTVNLDMIWIEPGTFIMGSPENELGRQSNEIQHQVTLTKGYWLGKYEVTQAQYEAVMGTNPSSEVFIGADMPVNEVEWDDAKEFCQKLTEMVKAAGKLPEGYEYALPTEAQWEYACRAGTTTAFNNGTNIPSEEQLWWAQPCSNLDEVGWYCGDSDYTLHPVGQKKPNAWGLYDMHGNVFEWCSDWYGDYPTSAVTDPVGADTGSDRVYRGGAWGDTAGYCRSANRRYDIPSNSYYLSRGFRVALVPVRPIDFTDFTVTLPGDVKLEMVEIEPGTFMMGSPEDELGRNDNETRHDVTLTQGYWLGKYEVTQAQYQAIMGTNPSYIKGVDLPVENVNWFDAKEFCAKLTAIEREAGRLPEGYEYTLPTEAQWEYACRAGTTTALNNGRNLSDPDNWVCPEIDEVAWYGANSNNTHHPVGQKKPNAWRLYDMHGNVEEWCLDWHGDYPSSPVTDPMGPVTGDCRVIRGGSCDGLLDAASCRSAHRYWHAPGSLYSRYLGFRVALAPLTKTKNMTIPLSEDVDLDMIWIEPGTFMMGSVSELGSNDDETWHGVTLTQGYWLGKYEVTQAQYEAVMGTNPSYFKGADLPVEQVSWYDATNFCAKLTARERAAGRLPAGYEYTLPTEAQWEYACRAGTWTALNSGENLSDEEQCPEMDKVGWYYYNSNDKTHPVGQKQPNNWGLYDMHGNVYEWCLDWYGDYPIFSVTDPTGPDTGDLRVQRGGGRSLRASGCRSAWRSSSISTSRYRIGGFRVALALVKNMTIPLSEDVDLNLTWIKPGTSMMGSPERELGRFSDETWHNVTLTKGYWMGKYEVTQAQYEAVMGTNPSKWKGADLPVEQVSWYDATNFCAKLTEIEKAAGRLPEGYEYTLPTEAQWEYACRAETWTALNSGKNLSNEMQCPEMDEVGWYYYNCEFDGKYTTHPVGQKQPNAWGLYDMHGNIWEWCLDRYGAYPTSAVTDPTGPVTGGERVRRGGAWYVSAFYCRSAVRIGSNPSNHNDSTTGFRVALAPVPVESKDMTIPLSDTVNLNMVWIEPGTFMMGSPEDELGRWDDETQHQVTLTQEYWLGKYEVTQAQYEAVMGTNPSHFKGADLPVEEVSWDDAKDFCARLTAIERAAGRLPEGYEYTLPTEAQWEYACRAGTTTALNSGKNLSDAKKCSEMDEVGWYNYNSDKMTHPVGQKKPNAWGLYDMHGNVEEWCLDWWGDYPASSVTDPTGSATGPRRVYRGGNWYRNASGCRSAYRGKGAFSIAIGISGFRVALAPTKNMTIPLSDTVNLDMIRIEPGTFTMGSPKDELGRNSNETQHEVTLTQGYWLGKYEVTQAQYKAVTGSNPSEFIGGDLPVENVTWYEAKAFCVKLTEIEKAAGRLPEGYEYTLPTEAQWEYACRAGMATALNSAKNLSDKNECPEMDEVGWYRYNSGDQTHPVGQKKMNAWGLYDMHGNVEEWCLDWAKDYPAGAATDPTGPETGTYRIVRGGGWNEDARYCRSASRDISEPDSFWPGTGFRVALAPVPESRNMTIPISEDVDLDMIWINPGTFIMGSPEDELGRDSEETQHKVTLTQGYWLGKFEVTQAQYEAIMGENPSYISGADLPVEYVAWEDAMEFCAKLTEIEKAAGRLPKGYEYTLPTEAQWEYACRAGTTTALNSGKNLSSEEKCPEVDEVAWYAYNTVNKTHPVGQKLPNAWGLYDMHGNVLEWCLDLYNSRGYPSSEVIDPIGTTGIMRVVRGGSYARSDAGGCRSAYRLSGIIGFRDSGFRVALVCNPNIKIPLAEDVNLDMIWIKPGTFIMGSPGNELGRDDDETQHQVTLTQEYWLGKYEVTQAQYEAVMGTNPSGHRYERSILPVECVGWEDAMEFCAKLTEIEKAAGRLPEGYEYTLPTEAQWEYACRAGTTTALNSGKNLSSTVQCPEMDEVGWYYYNSDEQAYPEGQKQTHLVGQKKPNAWGLYDMHGNVWEWCLDWYGNYPSSSVTDPTGPSMGSGRVLRGGSWNSGSGYCRSALRFNPSSVRAESLGFRVALTPVK